MRLHRAILAASIVALPGVSSAQGSLPAIYVDFGSPLSGIGIPSNSYAAAAPFGGQWNEFDTEQALGQTSYLSPALLDTAGQMTTITLEWTHLAGNGFNQLDFNEPNTAGDDEALMDDIGYGSGLSELRFRNLPAGEYDVYTYTMAPDSATFLTLVDVVGSMDPMQDVGGDFAGGFVQGTTHAFHSVTVDMSGELVINTDVTNVDDSINGVQILPSSGNPGVGVTYCDPAVPNVTGLPAVMFASGSSTAADNNLTLTCSQMAPNSFAFFITSQTQGNAPMAGGSVGTLCLGGAIGRYVGPGEIQNSGPMGTISLMLNLPMTPQPTGFVPVLGGQSWSYQAWYRDVSGGVATSNFSDGIQVSFF